MTSSITFSGYAAQLRAFILNHSASADDAAFNQLALSLFALQFSHNQPYRRFCEFRRAASGTVEHWSRIPAIPTVAFKEFELTGLPASRRARVFHSSGTTTQNPGRHFHDAESLSLYEASLLPWFQIHLLPELAPVALKSEIFDAPASHRGEGSLSRRSSAKAESEGGQLSSSHSALPCRAETSSEGGRTPQSGLRFLSLTPPPDLAPHSSLVHMFATVHRELGSADSVFAGQIQPDGVWRVDFAGTIAAMRAAIAQNIPLAVMGTAFNFVELADHLESSGLRFTLPAGSRILETGGYKGRSRALPKPALHELLSRCLGVPPARIVSEYGMSELSSQAYDLNLAAANSGPESAKRIFQFPPWARVQIISPETGREVGDGETGLVRVFDLANLHSVLAVQTEDLGVRARDGFELLGRAPQAELRGCSLMSA